MKALIAGSVAVILITLRAAPSMAAPIGPNLVQNGEFAFTNGPGQLNSAVTEAPPWHPKNWQLGFTVADQAVPDLHEYIALWDQLNTTSQGVGTPNNTWDGLSAHGGNFDALIVNTYASSISQTFYHLTAGKTYDVEFSYGFSEKHNFHRPTVQSMTVTLGQSSWTSPQVSLPAYGFSGWYDVTVQFTATAAIEVLTFQGSGSPIPASIYHAFPIPTLSNVSMYADDGADARLPSKERPIAIRGPVKVAATPRPTR